MHGPSYIEKCTYTKLPLKIYEDVPLIKTQNTRSQLHTMIPYSGKLSREKTFADP